MGNHDTLCGPAILASQSISGTACERKRSSRRWMSSMLPTPASMPNPSFELELLSVARGRRITALAAWNHSRRCRGKYHRCLHYALGFSPIVGFRTSCIRTSMAWRRTASTASTSTAMAGRVAPPPVGVSKASPPCSRWSGSRNETPFLHVMRENSNAHGLYERTGFRDHQESVVRVVSRC